MCANSSTTPPELRATAPAGGLLWAGSVMSSRRAQPSTTLALTRAFRYVRRHVAAPQRHARPCDRAAVGHDRWMPAKGEDAAGRVQAAHGRGDRERRRRAVRRARPRDALELDVDPEVPPRGVR